MMHIINGNLCGALLDYLSRRPYNEVAGFIEALQNLPQAVVKDDQEGADSTEEAAKPNGKAAKRETATP